MENKKMQATNGKQAIEIEDSIFALKQARNELQARLEKSQSMPKTTRESIEYALDKIVAVIKTLSK